MCLEERATTKSFKQSKVSLLYTPDCKREVGRPQLQWQDGVEQDLGKTGDGQLEDVCNGQRSLARSTLGYHDLTRVVVPP